MKAKIFGIVVVIIGAVLMFFSNYIAKEVTAGKLQIKEGQKKVDRADSLFSISKYSKPVGKQVTKSGQHKIDAGRAEVTKYETLSNQLRIGGVILIVIGAGVFFLWRSQKK